MGGEGCRVQGGHVGDCQNYGPFLGPYYNTGPNTGPNLGDPKRDHNFDNPPCVGLGFWGLGTSKLCSYLHLLRFF